MANFSQPLAIFYDNVSNISSNNTFYNNSFSVEDYQYEYSSHDNSTGGGGGSSISVGNLTSVLNLNTNGTDITIEKIQEETQDYVFVDFIIQGIILTITCILGAIGNTWSVIIFTRMRRKSSFTAFLLGLSFCDAVLVYTSILLFGLYAISRYLHCAQWYLDIYPFIVVYVYPVSSAAQTGSVYFTLGITVERYFAVCRPLQSRCSRFLATWKRGVCVAASLIVFSILFNIPKCFEYEVKTCTKNNVTTSCFNVTSLREHPLYIKYYVNYAYLIVMFAFPIIMLIVFNSIIYNQVQKNNRLRQRLSTSQTSENSLASILICVVVIFLVCDVLPLVNNIMEHHFHVYDPLIYVGNFLVAFNSSANFFIYYVCGKTFRQYFWRTVKSLICCCLSRENSDNSSTVGYAGEMNNITTTTNTRSTVVTERRQTCPIISTTGMTKNSNGIRANGHSVGKANGIFKGHGGGGGNCNEVFTISRRQAVKMNPSRQRASLH